MGEKIEKERRREASQGERMALECARIEEEARKYLGAEGAREFAGKVFKKALEAEDLLDRIKSHPKVLGRFEHDGMFFKPKRGGSTWHHALGGTRLLRDLTEDIIESKLKNSDGAELILDWLEDNVKPLRWRLENLEKHGTIGTVPDEEVKKEFEKQNLAKGNAPGSRMVN